jgi:hypothetical protein
MTCAHHPDSYVSGHPGAHRHRAGTTREQSVNGTRDESGDWYEIRLDGRLDPRWGSRFDGFDLVPGEDGSTVLRGRVQDQAALHGVLLRVRDIGVPILSVAQVDLA